MKSFDPTYSLLLFFITFASLTRFFRVLRFFIQPHFGVFVEFADMHSGSFEGFRRVKHFLKCVLPLPLGPFRSSIFSHALPLFIIIYGKGINAISHYHINKQNLLFFQSFCSLFEQRRERGRIRRVGSLNKAMNFRGYENETSRRNVPPTNGKKIN